METLEEARIRRLESRIERIERKEWERREFVLRLIANGLLVAMIIFATVSITLAATQPGH
jgi:hypothetical protein